MSAALGRGGHGAVAQHHGVVGDLQRLLEVVGDVDDRHARGRSGRGSTLNSTSTSVALSAEVGSSMIRMRAFDRQGAGDLDDLLLAEPQVLDQGRSGRCPPRARRISARVWRSSSAKSTPVRGADLAAHEDVVADAQVRREAELLVDDRDAAVARLRRWRRSSTGSPSRTISPEVGRSTPERIFISVDLPAPFSPNSVVTLPRWMSKLTPLSAWMPP